VPWKRIGCALALVALIATALGIRHVWWSMGESKRHLGCMNNLSQLAQMHRAHAGKSPADASRYGGPAMWLALRKDDATVRPDDERLFFCEDDDEADVPKTPDERRRWNDVDLDHVPRACCSYAGRDFARFPVSADPRHAPEPIGACVRHREGAMVAFDDGDVRFVGLAALGVASEDEMIVGPESKSPVLRVLRYDDGSVR
jgi:hypothetical protein